MLSTKTEHRCCVNKWALAACSFVSCREQEGREIKMLVESEREEKKRADMQLKTFCLIGFRFPGKQMILELCDTNIPGRKSLQ